MHILLSCYCMNFGCTLQHTRRITAASLIIISVWDLNGRQPFYPTKGEVTTV